MREVNLETQAHKVRKAPLVLLAHWVLLAHKDQLEIEETVVQQDKRAQLDK